MLLNDDEDVTTETLHKEHEQQGGGCIVVMYSSIFGLLQVNANTTFSPCSTNVSSFIIILRAL